MLRSVVGTTFMYSMPIATPISGSRSTGTRSMKFIRKIQQKIVSASGAMSLLEPWKLSRTWVSTNSTIISTKFCQGPGTPAVALRAANQKLPAKRMPSTTA